MVFALVFTGCEGPRGYPGYDGLDGYVNMETRTFTVKSKDWQLYGEPNAFGSYYYYDFQVGNFIDNYIIEKGAIIGSIIFNDGDIKVQSPLPYIIYKGMNGSNGNEILWAEKYTAEYNSGNIRFIVDYNDFMTNDASPGDISYKITVAWGE